MRNKLLNNNQLGRITNGSVFNAIEKVPVLSKDQIEQAKLVRMLPNDFPIAGWEKMNTKQQLQQMRYSGLNDQDQWSLLNLNVPLSVLDQHNQAQDEIVTRASATRIADTLLNAVAKATATAKAQTAVGKPTVSTPLQNNALRQKLDISTEEQKNKPLGKASGSTGAAVAPNNLPRFYGKVTAGAGAAIPPDNTLKVSAEEKSIVPDSRDAMEQKKDKLWDKIVVPTWREKREDEIWGKVNGSLLTESDNSDDALLSQVYLGASTAINKLRDAIKDKYLDLLKKDSDPKATWGTEMINDQSLYSKYVGTFGILGSTARNACGVVAIHNANQLLGFNTRFDDLSYMMQRSNIYSSNAYGLLGMNPVGLANLYERNGAEVTIYLDPQKVSKDHDAYIAVLFYPIGGHYVAADYNEATERFEVYNLDTSHETKELETLSAQSFKGTFGWVVWGIDAPEEYDIGSSGNNNSEVE